MPISSIVFVSAMAVAAIGQGLQSVRGDTPAQRPNAGERASRPYQRLFLAPPEPAKGVQVQEVTPERLMEKSNLQPRVVCGMVVVPVTPAVDPKMLAAAKNDPKTDYKIRVIEPRICKQ